MMSKHGLQEVPAADMPNQTKPAVEAGATKAAAITAETANFVVRTEYKDLPHELVELGKKSILDAVGLALAGEHAESGPLVRRYLTELGVTSGSATVFGTNLRTPARFAAFANGVAIHAHDFDDSQLALAPNRVYGLLTHPTVAPLSTALAIAEVNGKSGRDFMLAYHLGVEVETKLAEASEPKTYEEGFHSTGVFGVLGAAASAAKLFGLNAEGVCTSFGIAAAEASGLRENFGTMTKPFHAGHAAEGGVTAAELAALGWTAAQDIFEAKRGFFNAYGGGFDAALISGKLGNPWTVMMPGISIKPYPSGSLTHPAMDEVLRLVRTAGIKTRDIGRVRVGTNRQMLNTLIHHEPMTDLQAKFSMEYCVAILLIEGRAGLLQFENATVIRPDVQELLRRIDFYNNPAADAAGMDKMRSYIDIELKNGRVVSGRADFAKGSPQNPMSYEEVADKFRGCAEYAQMPEQKAKEIIAQIRGLEKIEDMRSFTRLLAEG